MVRKMPRGKDIIIGMTTLKDVVNWISKTKSISCLQKIRSKSNKRIKTLLYTKEESPFRNIPIEQKRKAIRPLLVNCSQSHGTTPKNKENKNE